MLVPSLARSEDNLNEYRNASCLRENSGHVANECKVTFTAILLDVYRIYHRGYVAAFFFLFFNKFISYNSVANDLGIVAIGYLSSFRRYIK